MPEIFYQGDLDLIRGRRIGILGYGNQGRAHALNLRDSGCELRAGVRSESRHEREAREDGFTAANLREVSDWADVISILLPDQVHHAVFEEHIRPALTPGKTLLFAHGFSVHFGQVVPPLEVDVSLVAPVGPGAMLRRLFAAGSGIPAVYAVAQNTSGQADALALAYAAALGCTRIGVQWTTFAEETETDLFGEQAVLCGGLPALISAGYETLIEAGYQPELAYFECVHQIKLIVDLIYEDGIAGMRAAISDTARFGSYLAGPLVVDDQVRAAMREILTRVRNGEFARRWESEAAAGMPGLRSLQEEEARQPMERIGAELRARMQRNNGEK